MLPLRRPSSDRSPESLEARLRTLPPPPVPGDLEARLLAAIPARVSSRVPLSVRAPRRLNLAVWVSASVAAAAVLLAVRLWPGAGERGLARDGIPNPRSTASTGQLAQRQPGDSFWTAPWLKAQEELEGTEIPTFTWPIQEKSPLMVSTALRPDLLD
jgi:hypothetical protein